MTKKCSINLSLPLELRNETPHDMMNMIKKNNCNKFLMVPVADVGDNIVDTDDLRSNGVRTEIFQFQSYFSILLMMKTEHVAVPFVGEAGKVSVTLSRQGVTQAEGKIFAQRKKSS